MQSATATSTRLKQPQVKPNQLKRRPKSMLLSADCCSAQAYAMKSIEATAAAAPRTDSTARSTLRVLVNPKPNLANACN